MVDRGDPDMPRREGAGPQAARPAADPDADDARRVLAGEIEAFEGIVRRWQRPMVNLAYRFCRDRGRAEEMAQDIFVRAYRSLASFRGGSAFSTWLFAIACNHCRSASRRAAPPPLPIEAAGEVRDPRSAHDLPDREDREEAVRRSVASLPRRYRDAVVLFYFFDMDLAAAAAALRLPEGTVKARLHRGRDLLRRKLSGRLTALPRAEKV